MYSEDLLIQAENENAGLVVATVLDHHIKHIEAHIYYYRDNPNAIHLLNHIQEHINLMLKQDKDIQPISLDDVLNSTGNHGI